MSDTTEKIRYLGLQGIKVLIDKLNEEYSPLEHEHSWENLSDRPFFVDGTMELIEGEHLFTITTDGTSNQQSVVSYNSELVDGQLYRIIINNINYDICACTVATDNFNGIILGNPKILNVDYESNSDAPFCLYFSGDNVIFYHENTGEYTVKVYIITADNLKQIDEVYIPKTIAREISIDEKIAELYAKLMGMSVEITLTTANWIVSSDNTYWTQEITIENSTANSKVELQPTPDQIIFLMTEEISMFVANNDGTIIAYAVNGIPSEDMIIKAKVTEV